MFKGYHVACFVFVSGYFYKTSYEQEPLVYIKRRVMRLLVPLLLINAVYGAIYVLVGKSGLVSFCDTGSVTWKSFVIHPFTTGHQFRFNLATWFIAPLFTLEVLNVLCRSALTVLTDHLDERTTETAFLVLYLLLGAWGIRTGGTDGLGQGLPVFACRTALFAAFFGMGRFYGTCLEKHDTASDEAYFAVLFALRLLLTYLAGSNLTYVISWCKFPDGVLVTYLGTITGIAFMLRFSRLLAPVIGDSRIVRSIGDNSFSIMCHHLLGFFLLSAVFVAVSSTTSLFPGVDLEKFGSSVYYQYYPKHIQAFAALYVAWGICFSLLVHTALVKVKGLFAKWAAAWPTKACVEKAQGQ